MAEKIRNSTTIEISIETYDKLHRIKEQIEKIVHKSISFDKTLQILLVATRLEEMLILYIVEE